MATAAIQDSYESIRPVHTPETGLASTNGNQPDRSGARLLELRRYAAFLVFAAIFFAMNAPRAAAQESMLYSFGTTSTDGTSPESNLVFDKKGNLYGTTLGGGPHSYGTVFELSPGTSGVWTERVLYGFGVTSKDAEGPQNIVFDAQGNLYGTAGGGQYGYGSVFELSPQPNGTWTEEVLHSFDLGEADGNSPVGSLVVDSSGNVYGATSTGGAHDSGTVFELSPGAGGVWSEKLLISFGPTFGITGPTAGLVADSAGNLYGTTNSGGSSNGGTVFQLKPASGGVWTENVLHNFPVNLTTDGSFPNGELILDSTGNLYGVTHGGGTLLDGVVYEVSPQANGTWTEQVLYGFDPTRSVNDGAQPVGSLAFDTKGNLYGATFNDLGGPMTAYGTVFKLTPKSGGGWTESVLHIFTGDPTPEDVDMDGIFPEAGVTLDAAGDIFGTTSGGGINAEGAFYEIAGEPIVDTPVISPASGTYDTAQEVEITDATPNAAIYYSNNGLPDTSSTLYTGPFTVSSTQTITAVAVAAGYVNSAYAVASYVIPPQVALPKFSVSGGTYNSPQTVTISDSTGGATIYYTTNGAAPTTSSTKYTGAITVSVSETLEAIAVAAGFSNSAVATAVYNIHPAINSELRFVTVTPCRIADTRNPAGPFGGPELTAGSIRTFNIPQSACGIPSTAVAYSLNVTVVPGKSLNYLTLWPAGQAQPFVSTLNSDGRVKANASIMSAGTNGGVSVYVTDATHVILDIDGYFVPSSTPSSLEFYPLTPCRVADTRQAAGALGGPSLATGASRAFPVQSSACNIPATAKAYSLNVTAIPHNTLNYLTAWNTGGAQPNVSTLNSSTGAVTANAAIVPAGSGGEVSIFVSDAADVILDVNGYFAPPATGGLSLYTVEPCRVIDTRSAAGAFNGVLTVDFDTSVCTPPFDAQAYVVNATVVPAGSLNYLSLWPHGEPQPNVSTLNAGDAAITSNMAIVPTFNGSVDAFSSNPTNLILDLSGYFAP